MLSKLIRRTISAALLTALVLATPLAAQAPLTTDARGRYLVRLPEGAHT